MEKSKKSQSGKSLFKNPISSVKFKLKNFQNVFVISVFLVFIFIMAATAISVWLSKQAEPPTVEEYCANCRVLDAQQENINLLKSPSTSLPVLRIFGKDIQVCHQACQNLRPIFNIQFECVPMAIASKETIKEVYMAFDFLAKGRILVEDGILTEDKLANEEKQEQKYIVYSSTVQGKVKMTDEEKEIEQVFQNKQINQNEQINQRKADQAAADLFLESDPKTVFFIGGYILTFDGIPNKDNICEVVNDPACPPKNSSFIPEENFFGLIKNCYARGWSGGRPSATTNHSSHWGGSRPSATTDHSSHWGGSTPSATSTPTIDTDFFSDDVVSDWSSITWNADGSATIGGGGPSQLAIDTATSFTTGSGTTYTTTGSWDNGTFTMGGTSSTGTTGSNTEIVIGGNNSDCNIDITGGGIIFNTPDFSVTFGGVEISYDPSATITLSANSIDYPELVETLTNLSALSLNFATAMSPELASLAAPADFLWIAQILSDPSQNFQLSLINGNLGINTHVQTCATIKGNTLNIENDVYVAFGDASWDGYFRSGSPHQITTSDGSNWELTMMTHTTSDGSLEFLAYNPNVNNGDGTFGNFVPYDPANPNANEIAYGYQLVVNKSAAAGTALGGPGPGPGPGPANNPPIAAIGCDCPLCETTTSITLNNLSQDLEDGVNFSNCLWNIYRYPSLVEVPPSPYNTCNDLFLLSLQVGNYQAKLTVTDQSGLSDTTTRDFYVLQKITALFDYEPEKPYYGEEVQFIDQSIGTQNPAGGNYNITNRDWTFKDVEGKESTQTSVIQNPIIIFRENGIKEVTLIVTDETNRSATYSEDIYVGFPPPNWKEVHPGQEQYNQQGQESCREKCESLSYMYNICREWSISSNEPGCEIGEEDIGETFDCKGSAEVERTCCCKYLQ
jgi:hypothetical protein